MATIYLVEDEDDFRDTLSGILETAGHVVIAASDGGAAPEVVKNHRLNLVISDLVMEGVEGIETILSIRRLARSLPILAISGNALYLENSAKLGTDAALLKPFTADVFLGTVGNFLMAREAV